jgi:hypothetical protein
LLARHCSEAGLIEKAAGLWDKAGQRSLARSPLLEAAEQLNHGRDVFLGRVGSVPQRAQPHDFNQLTLIPQPALVFIVFSG